MKTKNSIAFWYNLKGYNDIIIFDNKRNLNKFVKEYKEIYNDFENEKTTFEEFTFFCETLQQFFEEKIIKTENEIFYKDIKEDKNTNKYIETYINGEKTKAIICNFLEYGF